MSQIDWYYFQPGSKSCAKTEDYIEGNLILVAMTETTKTRVYRKKDLLSILKGVDEIHSVKGKKIVRVNIARDNPDEAMLERLLLGRTGNLRAPSIRVGRTLVIGYDPDTYTRIIGSA